MNVFTSMLKTYLFYFFSLLGFNLVGLLLPLFPTANCSGAENTLIILWSSHLGFNFHEFSYNSVSVVWLCISVCVRKQVRQLRVSSATRCHVTACLATPSTLLLACSQTAYVSCYTFLWQLFVARSFSLLLIAHFNLRTKTCLCAT